MTEVKFNEFIEEQPICHYVVTEELGETVIGLPLTSGLIVGPDGCSVVGEFSDVENSVGGYSTVETWY